MKPLLLLGACCVLTSATRHDIPQQVPVRELTVPSATSAETFGAILGVRHVANGGVIVNDARYHRLVLLDRTLATKTVVLDSAGGVTNAYGPRSSNLIPYFGDSSLFIDFAAQSMLLIDPQGAVARVMAPPRAQDLFAMGTGNTATDGRGRIVFRGSMVIRTTDATGATRVSTSPDTALLLRADFESRTVDTIAYIRTATGTRASIETVNGERVMKLRINPLPSMDDWAVLANGDVAVIRGSDYHVDWIRADGTTASSPKIPFDWRRVTDEEKRRLIDSARTAHENTEVGRGGAPGAAGAAGGRGGSGGGGGGGAGARAIGAVSIGRNGDGAPPAPVTPLRAQIEVAPPDEIEDYFPPIRAGAAKADRDGNVWILTATTAHSRNGELVYDVVNAKGELFQRVRFPENRSLAGFGPGGIVYLMHGDLRAGFRLERAAIAR